MYLFPISDLHVGINAHCLVSNFISNHFKFLNKYKDIVVCACGDIGPGLAGYVFLDKLQRTFPHIKIVYVLGNHEYYGHQINSIYDECALTNLTGNENIVILDGKHANNYVIDGVNFIGCTLWTDFNKGNADTINNQTNNIEKLCIANKGASCNITSPTIEKKNYNILKLFWRNQK